MREPVLKSLLGALERARVRRRPFPYLTFEEAFPPDVYGEMLKRLPPPGVYLPDNPTKYGLPDGSVARGVLTLGPMGLSRIPEADRPFWTEVAAALVSPELKERVFAALGRSQVPAHPLPSLIRDLPGYWIEPHPDSPAKLVTVLLYLPEDASQERLGTSLYRLRPWDLKSLFTRRSLLAEFERLPFLPRCGGAFSVGLFSWHGVERIAEGSGVRNWILLIYYKDASRAEG